MGVRGEGKCQGGGRRRGGEGGDRVEAGRGELGKAREGEGRIGKGRGKGGWRGGVGGRTR